MIDFISASAFDSSIQPIRASTWPRRRIDGGLCHSTRLSSGTPCPTAFATYARRVLRGTPRLVRATGNPNLLEMIACFGANCPAKPMVHSAGRAAPGATPIAERAGACQGPTQSLLLPAESLVIHDSLQCAGTTASPVLPAKNRRLEAAIPPIRPKLKNHRKPRIPPCYAA